MKTKNAGGNKFNKKGGAKWPKTWTEFPCFIVLSAR